MVQCQVPGKNDGQDHIHENNFKILGFIIYCSIINNPKLSHLKQHAFIIIYMAYEFGHCLPEFSASGIMLHLCFRDHEKPYTDLAS